MVDVQLIPSRQSPPMKSSKSKCKISVVPKIFFEASTCDLSEGSRVERPSVIGLRENARNRIQEGQCGRLARLLPVTFSHVQPKNLDQWFSFMLKGILRESCPIILVSSGSIKQLFDAGVKHGIVKKN